MILSALLKTATAQSHARLEAVMYVNEIMNKTLSLGQYKKLIMINYSVHQQIEKDIYSLIPPPLQSQLQLSSRSKLKSLERDMLALGLKNTCLNNEPKPQFLNEAEALGAMYVLEGATLGGNMIAKHLKNTEELKDQPFYFYTIYNNNIRSNWATFVEVLNTALREPQYENCIAKANETFSYFEAVTKRFI